MNPWKRKGLFYHASLNIYGGSNVYLCTVNKRLDFVSYHFIKWIHGQGKLNQMATNSFLNDMWGKK